MRRLIVNCLLIDGIADEAARQSWVLWENDKITDIGRNGQAPPQTDAEVIDGAHCCLLPGLINLHVHIQRRHLHRSSGGIFREGAPAIENSPDTKRLLWAVKNAWEELRGGVTTIRDAASKNRINNELRDYIKLGMIGGPRVISCGFGIAGTGGHETHRYQGAVEADGPDEIRKAVRLEIKMGADFIKFMASGGLGGMPEHEDPRWAELTVDELKAGVAEAHNRNRTATVHAMGAQPVLNALYAGIDGIEHGAVLTDEALDIMASRQVYYVPTLSGIATVAERELARGNGGLAGLMQEVVIQPQRQSVEKAYRRGIRIGCGTDTLGDMIQEMELLNACGLSRMDCIKAATAQGAAICRKIDEIGTIEKGKIADMILVQGNPLENLNRLREIRLVVKDGATVDSDWLCGF